MKISAEPSNSYFSFLCRFVEEVLVDGVKVDNVVTLDTDTLEYTISSIDFYDGKDYSTIYRSTKAKESIEVKLRKDTPDWLIKEVTERENYEK